MRKITLLICTILVLSSCNYKEMVNHKEIESIKDDMQEIFSHDEQPPININNQDYYEVGDSLELVGVFNDKLIFHSQSLGSVIDLNNRNEEISFKTNSLSTDAIQYGYLSYTSALSDRYICDTNNEIILKNCDSYTIKDVSYENKIFLMEREVNSFEYSGYETAIVGFDGEVLSMWTKTNLEDTNSDAFYQLTSLGENIYCVDTNILFDTTTNTFISWPEELSTVLEEYIFRISEDGLYFYDILPDDYMKGKKFSNISGFIDGKMLCYKYFNLDFTDAVGVEYYVVDKFGNYEKIGEVNDGVRDVIYNEFNNEYICVSFDYRVYNMAGDVIVDLSKYNVVSYDISNNYLSVILNSMSGIGNTTYLAIFDLEGNMMFDPIECIGDSICNIDRTELLGILSEETGTYSIYNYSGKIVDQFKAFTAIKKEHVKVFDVDDKVNYEYLYHPREVKISDNYLILKCEKFSKLIGGGWADSGNPTYLAKELDTTQLYNYIK